MSSQSTREESIRLIAHALEASDRNRLEPFGIRSSGRAKVQVTYGTDQEYLDDAERILDSEIVRMAEERVMERIRNKS